MIEAFSTLILANLSPSLSHVIISFGAPFWKRHPELQAFSIVIQYALVESKKVALSQSDAQVPFSKSLTGRLTNFIIT